MIDTVNDLIRRLEDFDPDMPLVFVKHPYRGMPEFFQVGDHDVVLLEEWDADADDPAEHVACIVLEYGGEPSGSPIDEGEWPGRGY